MKKIYLPILLGLIILTGFAWFNGAYLDVDSLGQDDGKQELSAEDKEKAKKDQEMKEVEAFGEYNVLLLGIDSRANKSLEKEIASKRYRTDTIILASLDTKNRKARLVSIPRDTRVKVKGSYEKINSAFVYGGVDLTKDVVEDFTGVKIDRTAIVDFHSLTKIVDLLGGVEIDVPIRMYRPTEHIDLKPGLQVLDGYNALAYSRFRGTSEGDIGRAKRQQQIIEKLARKIISVEGIGKIPDIYKTMEENVVTDVDLRETMILAKVAKEVLDNGVDTIVVPGKNSKIDGLWYWEADYDEFNKMMSAKVEPEEFQKR